MPRKRIQLAQNFLINEQLVRNLVEQSDLTKDDIVYEIGPGEGIITQHLASKVQQVIVIEYDIQLASKLQARFTNSSNVKVHQSDFLKFPIRHKSYKVFSNIPFNQTADIVHKLIEQEYPPEVAYLILQEEAAMKFAGRPNETEFSVLWKPLFEFHILTRIDPQNFDPVPAVQPVLFRLRHREEPLVDPSDMVLYRRFVRHGFESGKKNLKIAYKKIFTYTQWKRLAKDLRFPIGARPMELDLQQWLGLFAFLREHVTIERKPRLLDR